MRVFIVHAHLEERSFNGAMTRAAREALAAAGHEVVASDLYRMGFDPVSGRRSFTTVHDPAYFRQQAEEAHAAAHDGFTPDVQAEQDKLFWCDALVFQFPLWWFGLPAILKGRVDRVFTEKRAMCALTVGGGPPIYSEHGLNAPIASILFPINYGIFYFTGFTVIEPFLVHAPARMSDAERAAALDRYRQRARGRHRRLKSAGAGRRRRSRCSHSDL